MPQTSDPRKDRAVKMIGTYPTTPRRMCATLGDGEAKEDVRDPATEILRKIQSQNTAAVATVAASDMNSEAFHAALPTRAIVERPTGELAQLEALFMSGGEGISHAQMWHVMGGAALTTHHVYCMIVPMVIMRSNLYDIPRT